MQTSSLREMKTTLKGYHITTIFRPCLRRSCHNIKSKDIAFSKQIREKQRQRSRGGILREVGMSPRGSKQSSNRMKEALR